MPKAGEGAVRGFKALIPSGNSDPEPASKDGKDVFHRVPIILGEVRDAVERVLIRFRGARRDNKSGAALPEGEGRVEGEKAARAARLLGLRNSR